MDRKLIEKSVEKFQEELFSAITLRKYGGNSYPNGQKAKEALIRSQSLIQNIHEAVKVSMVKSLAESSRHKWTVWPPVNETKPELKIFGAIKGKNQDIVFLRNAPEEYIFQDGPNHGEVDRIGPVATENSIVIGVRSQMSSVDKNFDTLMERAFAETLNLRLRSKTLIMGEVYLIPVQELDDKAMTLNRISFATRKVKIEKFIRAFEAFSGRYQIEIDHQYKYDATALIPIDLSTIPAKLIFNSDDLSRYGFENETCRRFSSICGQGFDSRLLESYERYHD
jgi:hypothetical protein